MKHLNQADKMLVKSFDDRLKDVDSIAAESALVELEKSEPYLNPSHENHSAYLVMRSQIIARQIELSGRNPHESGNNANSSMLDNQRFHSEVTHDDELDFSQDDKNFSIEREKTVEYLKRLEAGNVAGVEPENLQIHIKTTRDQIAQLDTDQRGHN